MGGSGGGGGGGRFFQKGPEELQAAIRDQEQKTKDQAFEADVAASLGSALSDFERRDADAVNAALAKVRSAIEADIEGTLDIRFGGSVRKHTYVDGISDIDTLLIIKDPALVKDGPQKALSFLDKQLREKLKDWEISSGRLAITLRREGLEIQVLPAVRIDGELHIAAATRDAWSQINPEKFFRALTRANQSLSGKLVPLIKLIKIVNDTQPGATKLNGYHIESLAIEVFKNYKGNLNPKAMLEYFFDEGAKRVLSPIRDRSGQSVHVDDYLGATNSRQRQLLASTLKRIHNSMMNADAAAKDDSELAKQQWLALIGEDE
jgi:hypothetical protein